jgi:hypothetical protein
MPDGSKRIAHQQQRRDTTERRARARAGGVHDHADRDVVGVKIVDGAEITAPPPRDQPIGFLAIVRMIGVDAGWFLRRHWLMSLFVAGGVALRVLAEIAYRPAILYVDSVWIYLNHLPNSAVGFMPTVDSPDPLGYNMLMLWPLLSFSGLGTVIIVQHLLGLASAILIYAMLVRRGARRWLAALAAAPLLLDAYQIYIEHMIMSDVLFEALLAGAFVALGWNRRPGPFGIAIAGICLGASSTVRAVGLPLLVIFVVYVAFVARKWMLRLVSSILVVLTFFIPVLGYELYMYSTGNTFGANTTTAVSLYARAASFVDCAKLRAPATVKQLCPAEPLNARPAPEFYAHTMTSPIFHVTPPPGTTLPQLEIQFAKAAMTQQPLRLTAAVLGDAARLFTWNHNNDSNPEAPTERWRFQLGYPVYPQAVYLTTVQKVGAYYGDPPPHLNLNAAAFMREYQLDVGFTPGPLMALFLIAGVLGVCWRGRTRGAPMRGTAVLFLIGAIGVLGAADFYQFTWRYQLPGLVLVPAAGILGIMTLTWRRAPEAFPTADDRVAIDAFVKEHGEPRFPEVVIVVAAYNEANGIATVLDGMPDVIDDDDPVKAATLVVVDGATDDTAAIARKHVRYVCEMPVNRGQGAALKIGYYLARRGGARYIITTDADGQYDNVRFPAILRPIRDGDADFVIGSRRLGDDHSKDPVRRAGVRVFGFIISTLTGTRVTDTSSGFRAFTSEMTAHVPLRQVQYQTSELLIGALSRGYRVVEIPVTMRVRNNGRSKKGNNLVFGWRYARVVFTTWARERTARVERRYRNRPSVAVDEAA